jgi:hypothetical protein
VFEGEVDGDAAEGAAEIVARELDRNRAAGIADSAEEGALLARFEGVEHIAERRAGSDEDVAEEAGAVDERVEGEGVSGGRRDRRGRGADDVGRVGGDRTDGDARAVDGDAGLGDQSVRAGEKTQRSDNRLAHDSPFAVAETT